MIRAIRSDVLGFIVVAGILAYVLLAIVLPDAREDPGCDLKSDPYCFEDVPNYGDGAQVGER